MKKEMAKESRGSIGGRLWTRERVLLPHIYAAFIWIHNGIIGDCVTQSTRCPHGCYAGPPGPALRSLCVSAARGVLAAGMPKRPQTYSHRSVEVAVLIRWRCPRRG